MDPIDPIFALIDKTEELLGHSPHPAIVALPIGAWSVSNVCDALAMLTGDERYDDVARVSMAVGLVGAVGAIATGIRDYSHIPEDRPSHGIATSHALGNAVVSTLFTASYILRQRDHLKNQRTGVLPRLLALSAGGLSLYTAWLGGVLVEEHGEGVKPVMEHQDGHADHEAHGRQRLAPASPLGVHPG